MQRRSWYLQYSNDAPSSLRSPAKTPSKASAESPSKRKRVAKKEDADEWNAYVMDQKSTRIALAFRHASMATANESILLAIYRFPIPIKPAKRSRHIVLECLHPVVTLAFNT